METTDVSGYCVVLLVSAIGGMFVVFGLAIRLGYTKRYLLVRGPAPFFGPAKYHFIILLGGLLVLFGLTGLPGDVQTRQDVLVYVFGPCFILAFIIGLWQPWWLKPRWIRQLQENHRDIYPFLREAAQEEVGTDRKKADEWASKMDTVESQNAWVAEVRKRLSMPEPRITEGTEKE
jgi:hypothetical protein